MGEILLRAENIDKHFGITHALDNVSFTFNKGEIHALIGENGSGKSTMTNMLTGIYTLESGQFILDGKEVHPKNQVEANEEGISIIVQELGTLSGLTVAENIFLGHEDQFVHLGIKNTAAMNKKANELLQSYGFDKIKAGDMIDDYNFEDRKLVEIVKATYFNPKIGFVENFRKVMGNKDYAVSCVTNFVHYLEKLFTAFLSKCCCCLIYNKNLRIEIGCLYDLNQLSVLKVIIINNFRSIDIIKSVAVQIFLCLVFRKLKFRH